MSSRKATRPDLAVADVRPTWVPAPGDRVRLASQTRLAQVRYGTARVIHVSADGVTVAVSVDPNPNAHPVPERWVSWPLEQVRPATSSPAAPAPVRAS